jgi:hypothetical protein
VQLKPQKVPTRQLTVPLLCSNCKEEIPFFCKAISIRGGRSSICIACAYQAAKDTTIPTAKSAGHKLVKAIHEQESAGLCKDCHLQPRCITRDII